jgi:hypothetical protein
MHVYNNLRVTLLKRCFLHCKFYVLQHNMSAVYTATVLFNAEAEGTGAASILQAEPEPTQPVKTPPQCPSQGAYLLSEHNRGRSLYCKIGRIFTHSHCTVTLAEPLR